MTGDKIVPSLFLWILKICDYGQVDHGRTVTDDEGLVREMPLYDAKVVIKPGFKKLECIWIGRRCKSALEAVRCHVTRQLVIVPEKPAENFKLFLLMPTGEPTIPLGKPKTDRRCLRETLRSL